ncbi:hypothetical protein PQR62_25030 [Herbaspirillum lusitanum]|uniref:IclR family transcriptional regulator n=1 Tax=Herbaspirillum lusitanum TaxID=213312 RepID=A0ABW9AG48_9BURK
MDEESYGDQRQSKKNDMTADKPLQLGAIEIARSFSRLSAGIALLVHRAE